MKTLICNWYEDDNGIYVTTCGEMHEFMNDGPVENHYRYCPYCGNNIKVISLEEEELET